MHERLHECWSEVLDTRGDSVALIDAESGLSVCFNELDARAMKWLAENPQLRESQGGVWCVSLSSRIEWMAVCLTAIKVGAAILPLEKVQSGLVDEVAVQNGAAYIIDDAGVRSVLHHQTRHGYFAIKLTSGTTGAPKSLRFTELEMIADGAQIMRSMGISSEDRNYAVIPLGHSYGLGNLVMPFFIGGVSIVFGSSPFPQVMVEEMNRFQCTVLPLVPPLVKALASIDLEECALEQLRLVISAGSALKAEFAQRFYQQTGKRVHNFYGSSETGGICFDRDGHLSEVDGAIGEPLEGVTLSIGVGGSIRVQSAALSSAAYPDGKCTLHDLGKLDDAGVLHLNGRSAEIIKIAGRRLSLAEVESAMCSVNGVADVYVSSRKGRTGEIRCVALYAGELEEKALRAELLANMTGWKIPKVIRRVPTISYTARGKKNRVQLEAVIDALTAGS
ncbi:MAG: class I adenylate-forming enzyme family protein [Opitutaceae bacterium]